MAESLLRNILRIRLIDHAFFAEIRHHLLYYIVVNYFQAQNRFVLRRDQFN